MFPVLNFNTEYFYFLFSIKNCFLMDFYLGQKPQFKNVCMWVFLN